jgi:hypothetical protein
VLGDVMKIKSSTIAIPFCMMFILFNNLLFGMVQTDTTQAKDIKPDYTNVHVIIQSEWMGSDTTENVDVFLNLEGDKPSITMKSGGHKECNIFFAKGVTVKILDGKTGKLIKKYSR